MNQEPPACTQEIDQLRKENEHLRAALAGVSKELGLPPDIGPAKGELRRIKELSDKLSAAPTARSLEADFAAMTWVFSIDSGVIVRPGTFALVRMNIEPPQ